MTCINLKIRSNKGIKQRYCKLNKQWLPACQDCPNKAYKPIKPMKKSTKPMKYKTAKLKKAEDNRYSIFTDDLNHCIENKDHTGHIDKHECLRGSNRLNSIKYGLVVPLCRTCHDNLQIEKEWQIKGQAEFVKRYGYETFMRIFKRDYIEKWK